jgi:hypothetical protein
MRKITKSLLTLALLALAVGSAKARTSIDMSTATASTNATWTSATNTFVWTAENEYVVIPGLSGDLTGAYLDFSISGECRIDIVYTDDTKTTGDWNGYGRFGSGGTKRQDLGLMAGSKINSVKEVHIASTKASGNITIENVSYFYPVVPKFNSEGVATISLKSLVASDGLSFDPSTGVVTCNGTAGRLSLEFLSDGVNLNNLKRYDVTISGSDNIIWRSIVKSQGTDVLGYYGSRWGGNLADDQRAKATAVNEFFWESKSAEELAKLAEGDLTFTITSITLTADKMNVVDAHDVAIGTLPHYIVAANGTVSLGSAIETHYGSVVEQVLGDGSSLMDEYLDISDYDELRVYTSDNARVFFINAESIAAGTSTVDGATAKLDNTVSGQVTFLHNTSEGYYYASVSDIKAAYKGHAKVIGLKGASWGAKLTVSKIQVYKENPTYDYILSGQYSSAVDISAVTSSTSATAIDCSGLSGNNATITAGNPNCLFVAKSGVLANTKNVITSDVCANLVLTDGYPFKAPADFTATAASYTTTINTDAQVGTLCLPFAATVPGEVTAWTLTYTSGDKATAAPVATTIPANTPVLLNGSGSKTFSGSGAVSASATNVSGALTGVFAAATVPVNSYVLQKQSEKVGFFKVTGAKTINPFRAYLTAETPAPGLSIIFPEDSDVTGISEIEKMKNADNVTIFDLQGRKVAQPQKGLYIVNGKKVIFK